MMKKTTFLLFWLVGIVLTAGAAIDDIKFSRLDTRDGLSNSQILCVKRDSKGFVWIGTPYGLNRYDGYRIKTYYSYAKDTTTMRNNYVDEVFEAFDGKLWLKQGMNYTIYDPATEKFDRSPERWLKERGVEGGIEKLYIDREKDFWVKTYDTGFWHLNPYTGHVKHYNWGYGSQEFNSDFGLSNFLEIGGSLVISSHNGELMCFNKKKDWISWKDTQLRKQGLIEGQDCKLRTDHLGNIWMLTTQGSYFRANRGGKWIVGLQNVMKTLYGIEGLPDELSVWDLCVDNQKRIWLATDHTGLFVIDYKTKEVRQFLSGKHDATTISDNTLRILTRDQMGRIWIGTYQNGVNLYKESLSNFRNLEIGNITTISADRHFFWLGTNDAGIIRMDRKTGEQVVYDKANSGIASNTMVSSMVARDGSIWFGTYGGGLIVFRNGKMYNYLSTGQPGSLANNNVWSIHEDKRGFVWLGTLGNGIQRVNRATHHFDTPISQHNSIMPSGYISTVTLTDKNWLMVAHSNYYSIVNPNTGKVINRNITDNKEGIGVTETSICAMQDSRGLSWQGSSLGATIWDPKTNDVYLIDMRSGLFGSSVNGIVEDNKHTIWLVTDHGVSNIIVQQQNNKWNFIIRSFNNNDGLQNGPFNQRAICYTADGLVLVGGQGGLDIINPKLMKNSSFKELPVFGGLKVFGQDVEVGQRIDGRVVLEKALSYLDEITLSYNAQFTIQLGSSDGGIHNRSSFVYKLDGVNADWIRTEEVNPNITYMSLPSGSYKLRVRMLNDDGTIAKDEVCLTIHILPPFWRSWWAYLIYIVLLVMGAHRLRKLLRKRDTKRRQVEERRREMDKQQWMNEMRRKMGMDDAESQAPRKVNLDLQMGDFVAFLKHECDEMAKSQKSAKISKVFLVDHLDMEYDPKQISRMLNILFDNSVKFAVSHCRVSIGLIRQEDGNVQIQFADNGLGVTNIYKDHAFDRMPDGEGIGLDIVRDIVVAHGGKIRLEDNPGGGTIFVITLPAGSEVEEAEIME